MSRDPRFAELLSVADFFVATKVNRVTCPHRHGNTPRAIRELDQLCNAQLDFEKVLASFTAPVEKDGEPVIRVCWSTIDEGYVAYYEGDPEDGPNGFGETRAAALEMMERKEQSQDNE